MTFAEFKAKVEAYIVRTDLTAMIPFFVNTGMRRLERASDYGHMEQAITPIALAEGAYTFAVPANYKKLKSAFLMDVDGRHIRLQKKDKGYAMSLYPDLSADKGTPEYICFDQPSGLFYIRPTLDAAYTTEVIALCYSTDLANDADTNFWLTDASDVLLEATLQEVERYNNLGAGYITASAKELQAAELEEELAGSPQFISPSSFVP